MVGEKQYKFVRHGDCHVLASVPVGKTDEVREICAEYSKILEDCQAQNKRLIEALRYYAQTDWREISMSDRGNAARSILREELGI